MAYNKIGYARIESTADIHTSAAASSLTDEKVLERIYKRVTPTKRNKIKSLYRYKHCGQ